MFDLSDRSKKNYRTLHKDLQAIVDELSKEMAIEIIEGYRGREEQNKAYREGKSTLVYPFSKHNQLPSKAMDLAPLPINWKNIKKYKYMNKRIQWIANRLGIQIRLGMNFSFRDYGHIEIV